MMETYLSAKFRHGSPSDKNFHIEKVSSPFESTVKAAELIPPSANDIESSIKREKRRAAREEEEERRKAGAQPLVAREGGGLLQHQGLSRSPIYPGDYAPARFAGDAQQHGEAAVPPSRQGSNQTASSERATRIAHDFCHASSHRGAPFLFLPGETLSGKTSKDSFGPQPVVVAPSGGTISVSPGGRHYQVGTEGFLQILSAAQVPATSSKEIPHGGLEDEFQNNYVDAATNTSFAQQMSQSAALTSEPIVWDVARANSYGTREDVFQRTEDQEAGNIHQVRKSSHSPSPRNSAERAHASAAAATALLAEHPDGRLAERSIESGRPWNKQQCSSTTRQQRKDACGDFLTTRQREERDADLRFQPEVSPSKRRLSSSTSQYLEQPVYERLYGHKSLSSTYHKVSSSSSSKGAAKGGVGKVSSHRPSQRSSRASLVVPASASTAQPRKGAAASSSSSSRKAPGSYLMRSTAKGRAKGAGVSSLGMGNNNTGGKTGTNGTWARAQAEVSANEETSEEPPRREPHSEVLDFAPPPRDGEDYAVPGDYAGYESFTSQDDAPGPSGGAEEQRLPASGNAAMAGRPPQLPRGATAPVGVNQSRINDLRSEVQRDSHVDLQKARLSNLFHAVDKKRNAVQPRSAPGAAASRVSAGSKRSTISGDAGNGTPRGTLFPGGCGVAEAVARSKNNPRDLDSKYSPTKRTSTRGGGGRSMSWATLVSPRPLPSAHYGNDSNPYLFARRVFEKVHGSAVPAAAPSAAEIYRKIPEKLVKISDEPQQPQSGGNGARRGSSPHAQGREVPSSSANKDQSSLLNMSGFSMDASKVSAVPMPRWAASPILNSSPALELSPPTRQQSTSPAKSSLFQQRVVPMDVSAHVQRAGDERPGSPLAARPGQSSSSTSAPRQKMTTTSNNTRAGTTVQGARFLTSTRFAQLEKKEREEQLKQAAEIAAKVSERESRLANAEQAKKRGWSALCYEDQNKKWEKLKKKYPEKFLSAEEQEELEVQKIQAQWAQRRAEHRQRKEQLARVMQPAFAEEYNYGDHPGSPDQETTQELFSTSVNARIDVEQQHARDPFSPTHELPRDSDARGGHLPGGGGGDSTSYPLRNNRSASSRLSTAGNNSFTPNLYDDVPSKLQLRNPALYMDQLQMDQRNRELQSLQAEQDRAEKEMEHCTFDPFAAARVGPGMIHNSVFKGKELPKSRCLRG
ncbi:unnamed protein product [Amoebophrya sp. A120]|nr:unnamed protein product [Amoebophrya sp. A120]|eukprot:GSA120T00005203001.1